jgi:hypothetical protein
MLEDRPLEPPQLVARLEAELVGKQTPALAVHIESFGLTSRPIERQHQLCARALPERLLPDERLELGDLLTVEPELELRIDPVFERRQPLLLELTAFREGDRAVEIGERRFSPEPKSFP